MSRYRSTTPRGDLLGPVGNTGHPTFKRPTRLDTGSASPLACRGSRGEVCRVRNFRKMSSSWPSGRGRKGLNDRASRFSDSMTAAWRFGDSRPERLCNVAAALIMGPDGRGWPCRRHRCQRYRGHLPGRPCFPGETHQTATTGRRRRLRPTYQLVGVMTLNLYVGDLNPASRSMAVAAESLENATLPGVPDAGPSSSAIASTLAALTSAMSAAAHGCARASDVVESDANAYHSTDADTSDRIQDSGSHKGGQ